jgi:DNA-binding PadR family transcriptional regulator
VTTHFFKRSPFAVPVVLGLLDERPRHGYALFAQVQSDLHDVWYVGMNRLYALLDEMERDGLIKGHVEREGARPSRRVFHITAKGKKMFERWLHEPNARMTEMRADFPPKLYFALQRGPQDVAELVQAQRGACQKELDRMSGRQRDIGSSNTYRSVIYDFRVRQIHAILEWLDACEAQLVAVPVIQRKTHSIKRKTA